jgi:hypothetical protein
MIARRLLPVLALCFSSRVSAQGTTPFELLTRPGPGFGTCLPTRDSLRKGSRLVIKSRESGRSREITVLVDSRSRSASYADIVSAKRDSVSGTTGSVIAAFDSAGRVVVGFRTQALVEYPSVPRDLAAIRAMRDSMKGTSSSQLLTLEEQQRVVTMVAFLRQRCPT